MDDDNRTWAERYRLAGEVWADLEAAAQLLEDTKSLSMAQRQQALGDIPVNRAEQTVKASPEWQEYVENCVKARQEANIAKVNLEAMRMAFHEHQNSEANRRVELKILGDTP